MSTVPRRAADRLRQELPPFLFAVFIFLFLVDAVHNRLGSSNGRFISFVDTCRSVAQYRSGLPDSANRRLGTMRWILIALSCLLVKFAATSTVSMLLGIVPVVFNGPRHIVSFFLGFVVVWLSPGDVAYYNMRHSRALKLLVDMGGGLYKMRKVIFAVEAATTLQAGLPFAALVAVLAVDGTTLTRRAALWVEARIDDDRRRRRCPTSLRPSTPSLSRAICDASGRGVRETVVNTIVPIGAVTALVWAAAASEWINGINDDSFLGLRAALLALFIWRAGAFNELARIHAESMEIAEQANQPDSPLYKSRMGSLADKAKAS